ALPGGGPDRHDGDPRERADRGPRGPRLLVRHLEEHPQRRPHHLGAEEERHRHPDRDDDARPERVSQEGGRAFPLAGSDPLYMQVMPMIAGGPTSPSWISFISKLIPIEIPSQIFIGSCVPSLMMSDAWRASVIALSNAIWPHKP